MQSEVYDTKERGSMEATAMVSKRRDSKTHTVSCDSPTEHAGVYGTGSLLNEPQYHDVQDPLQHTKTKVKSTKHQATASWAAFFMQCFFLVCYLPAFSLVLFPCVIFTIAALIFFCPVVALFVSPSLGRYMSKRFIKFLTTQNISEVHEAPSNPADSPLATFGQQDIHDGLESLTMILYGPISASRGLANKIYHFIMLHYTVLFKDPLTLLFTVIIVSLVCLLCVPLFFMLVFMILALLPFFLIFPILFLILLPLLMFMAFLTFGVVVACIPRYQFALVYSVLKSRTRQLFKSAQNRWHNFS